jgi:YegS/Rv2252/BmrU family lipid kinase
MNLVFIYKGTPSNKRKIEQVLSTAKSSGVFNKVSAYESQYAGNSIEIAQKISAEYDYIIAVGGDGTLNEVINGVMQYHHKQQESSAEKLPILGILPLGTANDFVKSTSLKSGINELISLIKNKQHRKIDIGKLQCFKEDRTTLLTRYFINIADVGFGAHVVHKTNKGSSIFGANATYTKAILGTFLSYKPKQITVQIDDQPKQTSNTLSLIFANGKYFASGLGVAPHANLSDGELAITHIGNVSMFDFLFYLGRLKKCKKLTQPEAKYFKAKHLEVSSEDKNAAVEADGEFIGYLPLKVDVIPQKIAFLIPI